MIFSGFLRYTKIKIVSFLNHTLEKHNFLLQRLLTVHLFLNLESLHSSFSLWRGEVG
jgi:hypothetical protein